MADTTRNTTEAQSDLELAEATLEALVSTLPVGLAPTHATAAASRAIRRLVTQPGPLLRRGALLAGEQLQILAGATPVPMNPKDRRFSHEAWTENALYKRLGQSYLSWHKAVHGVIDDLDLDEKSRMRAEFVLNLITEAAAPTNTLLGNPAAVETAIATKGSSLIDGARHAIHDIRHNGGMPSMVDTRPFTPGENIACSPGNVVFRNAVLELIQYAPTTAKVHARPLLIVPPQINKFYILDLAPGRSLIEHIVGSGHQTFVVSWRNPTAAQRDWDLNTYVAAILEATEAIAEITGSPDTNLLGVCAGGITSASMLGHLTAIGDERIHSVSFLVTILDWSVPSTMGTFISAPVINAATRRSQSKGVLAGSDLNRLFAWLRPNDLVWNYVVNNYLLGKNPPAFDVLAWNGDATNLPAALHADFMAMAVDNSLVEAHAVEVLETTVNLADINIPSFVVGAETDHITPWQACYETINILGGESEFVLSTQGHIQALVNPAGNPKSNYFTNVASADSPDEWLAHATKHAGSWWDYWMAWLKPHAGAQVKAPANVGSEAFPADTPAPGAYING